MQGSFLILKSQPLYHFCLVDSFLKVSWIIGVMEFCLQLLFEKICNKNFSGFPLLLCDEKTTSSCSFASHKRASSLGSGSDLLDLHGGSLLKARLGWRL